MPFPPSRRFRLSGDLGKKYGPSVWTGVGSSSTHWGVTASCRSCASGILTWPTVNKLAPPPAVNQAKNHLLLSSSRSINHGLQITNQNHKELERFTCRDSARSAHVHYRD